MYFSGAWYKRLRVPWIITFSNNLSLFQLEKIGKKNIYKRNYNFEPFCNLIKKCVTEKRMYMCKQRVQTSKSLSFNGFIVNIP